MWPSVCSPSARPLATIHGVPGTWTRSSALVNPQTNVRPAAGSHAACAATGAEITMAAANRTDALLKPMIEIHARLGHFGRYFGPKTTEPVSRSDLRFDRIC